MEYTCSETPAHRIDSGTEQLLQMKSNSSANTSPHPHLKWLASNAHPRAPTRNASTTGTQEITRITAPVSLQPFDPSR